MQLVLFIIVPILIGVISYPFGKYLKRFIIFAVEIPLLSFGIFTLFNLSEKAEIREILGAKDEILGITLVADRSVISLICLTIFLFSISFFYSIKEEFFDSRFVMLFFILQGLLSGIFLTDDIFNIYVLLEVATVVVAILIMFKKESSSIYDAVIYLFSQVISMVFYLFGIGYLYKIFGVLSISEIEKLMPLAEKEQLVLPFAFILTAICLKSAFFPLYSWLPRAHGTKSAPSAVSAILSGLYVKNGIYLFIMFTNLFSAVVEVWGFFAVIGLVTATLGFLFAIIQKDIKLILAYSTISQIGLITLSVCLSKLYSAETSYFGALYHIINHAFFKSLLFLSAGVIIKAYGTRDINEIRGVFRKLPIVGTVVLIGVLGITGAPFLNGSVSKYFMAYGVSGTIWEYIFILLNGGTILAFVRFSHILFGKNQRVRQEKCKSIALIFLSLGCVLGGIFGTQIMNYIFATSFEINLIGYIEKSVIFLLTTGIAVAIYRKFIVKKGRIFALNNRSINFLEMVLCIVIFFLSLSITTNFIK